VTTIDILRTVGEGSDTDVYTFWSK